MRDMMKKKGVEISDNEKEAKMSVVKAMRDMAQEQMGGKLHGLKKVVVSSNDEEGLKKGLEKAKELIGQKEMPENSEPCDECKGEGCSMCEEESSKEDVSESPEEETSEDEQMSEEELNAKLQKLMAIKKKMDEQKA